MNSKDGIIGTSLEETDSALIPPKINLDDIIQNNKWTIGFVLLGVLLLGIGIFSVKSVNIFQDDTKVEVLGSSSTKVSADKEALTDIVVEIAGEVIKPGVYEFADGDRVTDLLTKAGGLSANADREYVSKNINLAQKLVDGAKIYIPNKSQAPSTKIQTNTNDQSPNIQTKININTATIAELDTLWGVGEATAKKIVDGRPYQKTEELLQKKIVNSNVWEAIKDKITTW